MSKQDFTETLKFGKCRCGAAAQEGHHCPATGASDCPCCDNCYNECHAHVQEIWDSIAEQKREEMDRMVMEEMLRYEQENPDG